MRRASLAWRLAALVLALAAGAAGAAQAESDFPAAPPAPGPAATFDVPTPVSSVLSNGLQVVSVRRAQLPLVTAQLLLRSGGERDPQALAGLADLTARLLARGAAGRSAPQIAARAEALGGSLDAAAGWDESTVGITITTPELPQALALLADLVRRPDFSSDELERARVQAIDDVRLDTSQATTLAMRVADRAVFGTGAYGHSRAGTLASLARITRHDVQALHAALYRPDNAILVLAGDITAAQALQLARAGFGDWRAPATPLPPPPPGAGVAALPAWLAIEQPGAGQASVVVAHLAPSRGDGDFYAGTVADAVLGGSYSARLNEQIRIRRGLSYDAASDLDLRGDSGIWLASAQTRNPSAAKVVDLILGEFARLGNAAVGKDELSARKAALIGAYGRSMETTAGLAAQVGELAVHGIDPAEIGRYVQRVQAVTPAQVRAYAKAHLGDGAKVVVVGDASRFGAALRRAHPQVRMLASGAIDLDDAALQGAAK